MSEIVIDIKDLKLQYPDTDVPALNGVTLSVEKGEFVGILGAHGAGKTSLCLSINGIVPNMINADIFDDKIWFRITRTIWLYFF